ncbi:uncharacterized protein [Triticum aestivum]|nr:uncharacterized protein LOC123170781 [Triticum aestivum]
MATPPITACISAAAAARSAVATHVLRRNISVAPASAAAVMLRRNTSSRSHCAAAYEASPVAIGCCSGASTGQPVLRWSTAAWWWCCSEASPAASRCCGPAMEHHPAGVENPSPNSRHNPHSSSSPIDAARRSDTGASTPELPRSASPCCSPALPRVLLRRRGCLRHRSLLPRAAPLPPPPPPPPTSCLPPKSPLFHPQSRFFFLPLRLLLARGGDTSSSFPPTPEEARGKQQCLALRLRHLGCAWAYAPVAASAVRQSAKEEEGGSVRRQGVLGMLLESPLFRPLLTSLIKKQNNMTQMLQRTGIPDRPMFFPEYPLSVQAKAAMRKFSFSQVLLIFGLLEFCIVEIDVLLLSFSQALLKHFAETMFC